MIFYIFTRSLEELVNGLTSEKLTDVRSINAIPVVYIFLLLPYFENIQSDDSCCLTLYMCARFIWKQFFNEQYDKSKDSFVPLLSIVFARKKVAVVTFPL